MFRKLRRSIVKKLARLTQSVWNATADWPPLIKRISGHTKTVEKLREETKRNRDEDRGAIAGINARLTEMSAAHERLQGSSDSATASLWRAETARTVRARLGAPPAGATRSAVFIEQSYYHHYYLARALRARGWDSQLVCFHDPGSRWTKYYHGQDVLLWSDDPAQLNQMRDEFFHLALGRFQMAHFSGDGLLSIRSPDFNSSDRPDLAEWRAHGKLVGFTISGCNTGTSKETVARWSLLDGGNVCEHCKWKDSPEVCSPENTLKFGAMLEKYCSLVCGEEVPRLDYMNMPSVISEPLTMCLDENVWSPELQVPEKFRIDNAAGDILIYHGMGETEARTDGKTNIKGTHAIESAVERLRQEGHAVRFVFATGMSNRDVRFKQVQADIIVDQLNYGRYGAQAREGMMLGKPVICYLNKHELNGPPFSLWDECPLVSASEETIYEELKRLVMDVARRKEIGRASRDYALKWHSPAQCARRYEMVYDELMRGTTDFSTLVRSSQWRDGGAS